MNTALLQVVENALTVCTYVGKFIVMWLSFIFFGTVTYPVSSIQKIDTNLVTLIHLNSDVLTLDGNKEHVFFLYIHT